MNERKGKRYFQRIKGLTYEKFMRVQNILLTRAYEIAERHYKEAMEIELEPRFRKRVLARVESIRQDWDNINTEWIMDDGDIEV